jgi:23S rRNA pseudouridine1911/1915/1917 synthase
MSAETGDEQVFMVGEGDQNKRLDVYLAAHMVDVSRSQLQRLIDTRSVQVNGGAAKASDKTQVGDLILVSVPAPRESHISAQEIPLDIVYEDSDILVINKAKGMVVHPAPGAEDGTLVNALLAHSTDLSGIGGVLRPGIVHRLDKDTTGLLVVAKHDVAHNGLQAQIQRREAKRRYLAIAWGRPPFEEAVIDVPIGRHPTDRKRMAVMEINKGVNARNAVTEVKVREHLPGFTVLECSLQTGRTHQIRVHCSFAGYPIVGDPVYGGIRKAGAEITRGPALVKLNEKINSLHGQALHAFSLAFDHPTTGQRMEFEAPPPAEMQDLWDFLRNLAREDASR